MTELVEQAPQSARVIPANAGIRSRLAQIEESRETAATFIPYLGMILLILLG